MTDALPYGVSFGGAFHLDVGPDGLKVPVQLAVPVPPSTPVGRTVYFYRAGQHLNDDGSTTPIWWCASRSTSSSETSWRVK